MAFQLGVDALMFACARGCSDVVRILLGAGANAAKKYVRFPKTKWPKNDILHGRTDLA